MNRKDRVEGREECNNEKKGRGRRGEEEWKCGREEGEKKEREEEDKSGLWRRHAREGGGRGGWMEIQYVHIE